MKTLQNKRALISDLSFAAYCNEFYRIDSFIYKNAIYTHLSLPNILFSLTMNPCHSSSSRPFLLLSI